MKYCPFCYVKNPDDAVYCRHCGGVSWRTTKPSPKKSSARPSNKGLAVKILITTVIAVAVVLGFVPLMEADLPNLLTGIILLIPIGILISVWSSDKKI